MCDVLTQVRRNLMIIMQPSLGGVLHPDRLFVCLSVCLSICLCRSVCAFYVGLLEIAELQKV